MKVNKERVNRLGVKECWNIELGGKELNMLRVLEHWEVEHRESKDVGSERVLEYKKQRTSRQGITFAKREYQKRDLGDKELNV